MSADVTTLHPDRPPVCAGRDRLDVIDELEKQASIIVGLEVAFVALTKDCGAGVAGLCWVLQDVGDKLRELSEDLQRIA